MTFEEKILNLVKERVVLSKMKGPVSSENPWGSGVELHLRHADPAVSTRIGQVQSGSLDKHRELVILILKDLLMEAIDLHECAERLVNQIMES